MLASIVTLSRQELQKLAKAHGVKANQKTEALILELSALLGGSTPKEPEPEPTAAGCAEVEPVEADEPMTSMASAMAAEAIDTAIEQAAMDDSEVEAATDGVDAHEPTPDTTVPPETAPAEQLPVVPAPEAPAPAAAAAFTVASTSAPVDPAPVVMSWEAALKVATLDAASTTKRAPSPALADGSAQKRIRLPRVATIKHPTPPVRADMHQSDRFAVLHKVSHTPPPNAYDVSAKATAASGPTFGSGPSDRFAGPDSRYKKGLRKSTLPVHDPSVFRAKTVDETVPLPNVRSHPANSCPAPDCAPPAAPIARHP